MARATHRIYLAPERDGQFRQTAETTAVFYDINPCIYLDAVGKRWYRVISAGPGYPLGILSAAAPAEITDDVLVLELGALMRLFSNRWYVDSQELSLEQARPIDHPVLTWPRLLAFCITFIVFAYILIMDGYVHATGAPLADFRPLTRMAGITMSLLLLFEWLADRSR